VEEPKTNPGTGSDPARPVKFAVAHDLRLQAPVRWSEDRERDGEMGTPVLRTRCTGFCELPILSGIAGKRLFFGFLAEGSEKRMSLRSFQEMCARES